MTGADLKRFRDRHTLTQVEAAGLLGVTERSVRHAETNSTDPLSPRSAQRLLSLMKISSQGYADQPSDAAGAKEIVEAIETANSPDQLFELEKRVGVETVREKLSVRTGVFLVDLCRSMRHTLKVKAMLETRSALLNVRLMTLDEVDALREVHASRTPKPLAPGECPPPPPAGEGSES